MSSPLEDEVLGTPAEADGDRVVGAFVQQVLGRADDMEVAEADAVVPGAAVGVPLAGPGDRDLAGRGFQVDAGNQISASSRDHPCPGNPGGVPPSWRFSLGDLGAALEAGPTTAAERFFLIDEHAGGRLHPACGRCTCRHPHRFRNGGRAPRRSDTVTGKGLALFLDLLVETRADHIQESVKLGAGLHLGDEPLDLAHRKSGRPGQVRLHLLKRERCSM